MALLERVVVVLPFDENEQPLQDHELLTYERLRTPVPETDPALHELRRGMFGTLARNICESAMQ